MARRSSQGIAGGDQDNDKLKIQLLMNQAAELERRISSHTTKGVLGTDNYRFRGGDLSVGNPDYNDINEEIKLSETSKYNIPNARS